MFAIAEFTPLFLAILICWIFSVCLHEFAHAFVAYLGGDHSVVEKGYLDFNPFKYIHPLNSIIIPVIVLAVGGLPLPGAAVYIDRSALRSKHWDALVSAAGPAANFILFLILAWIIHPSTGFVDPNAELQPTWVTVAGAMCVLQIQGVLFNLVPLPPLDGFGILAPYLPRDLVRKAYSQGMLPIVAIYFLFDYPFIREGYRRACHAMIDWVGLPWEITWRCYNYALFGSSQ